MKKLIYHYTTQDGLIGILREKALWATKIHYMNDATELTEPLKVALDVLTNLREDYAARISNEEDKDLVDKVIIRMMDDISTSTNLNICVISFCQNGDILSQWRGYGIPGSNYSIGIDENRLIDAVHESSFELRPCEYFSPEAYRNEIKVFVTQIILDALTKHEIPGDFQGKLIKKVTTMKLDCFKEEDEQRLVSRGPLSFTDEYFGFRIGKSLVIPYYSLPIDLSIIAEIVVGPCPHPELAKDAIYGLAWKYNLESVQRGNVKLSRIPYRFF